MSKSKHQQDIAQYVSDVLKGTLISCTKVKQACKRYVKDLKRAKDASCLWEYNPELVDNFLDFTEQLKIGDLQTETKKLVLLPWQKFVYANLIGFVFKHDPEIRRFRKSFILVSRKNGKTTGFLLPLLIYDFIITDAAESYLISGDGSQAQKTFQELAWTIKADKELAQACNVATYTVTSQRSRISFFSCETTNLDSYKPSLAVIDEYFNYESNRSVTSMEYGMRARKNGSLIIITSAGTNISGPAYEEYQRASRILSEQIENDGYFTIIYQYDEDDLWNDTTKLIKANPSLGYFLREDILLKDLNDALQMPSMKPEYVAKTLGLFTNAISSWLSLEKWDKNSSLISDEQLLGQPCWAAFDLSSVSDFTAYTKYFYIQGKFVARHIFYIPQSTVHERYKKENVGIYDWIEKGYITVIPGSSIDYDYLFNDIIRDSQRYQIKEIAYDRWNSHSLVDKLEKENTTISYIEFNQGLQSMSPCTKSFEKAVLDIQISDSNPVMKWMITNVSVRADSNGNVKPLKPNSASTQRIDGVVTSIMALSRLQANSNVENKEWTREEILKCF